MASEHVVARVGEITEGKARIVEINGREIGVFNVGGEYFALPNVCIHQYGPLCQGRVSGTTYANIDTNWKVQWGYEGEIVTCPWHSLEFNIKTGQCLAFPNRKLRTYPIRVDGDQVKVTV